MNPLNESVDPNAGYRWPQQEFEAPWTKTADAQAWIRAMPESPDALSQDSRWPAFFPSPICVATVRAGNEVAVEKLVGASIVNRFPYVLALSVCRVPLSARHHPRSRFMELLEKGGAASVQFLAPGPALSGILNAAAAVSEDRGAERVAASGREVRPGESNEAPVFADAYMVYEGHLVRPAAGFAGEAIFERPWTDAGSHRVYFLEINCIQLREDIASGRSRIHWRSLPDWTPGLPFQPANPPPAAGRGHQAAYQKPYTPTYAFPTSATAGFEAETHRNGMAVRHLPPLPEDQVEVDNDRARWPCFFPSPLALITTWSDDGRPNVMPCGSTMVLSRSPLIIATSISYARINVRYAERASLGFARSRKAFGCGVPYIHDDIVAAIKYLGNVSFRDDPDKVARSGLAVESHGGSPVLPALPVQFDCRLVGEQMLGTHALLLGEVERIRVRADVSPGNPLRWCPYGQVGD